MHSIFLAMLLHSVMDQSRDSRFLWFSIKVDSARNMFGERGGGSDLLAA